LPVPDIGIDRTVVVFAVGVTVVTGIVFGLAPAWHGARQDVNGALKDAGRSSTNGAHPLFRRALASIELALATVLLIGAALLVQSLITLQRVPLGFDPRNIISFQISLPPTKYDAGPRSAFFHELGTAMKSLPGVRDAGISSGIPFGVGNYTTSPITAPGRSVLPPGTPVPMDWRIVSPGFFDTLRIPLLRGRDFADSDTAAAPQVVIVSRAAAQMLWGSDDPMGRRVRRPADGKEFTVVGVVGDVRSTTLNQESPALYYSSMARTWPLMDIVVRPAGDAATVMTAIRRTIRGLDAEVALANVRPMTEWVWASAAQPRLNATLLAFFACVSLLVAAIGTYGVLAYSVAQRTKELGLRMALGADRAGVLGLVLREGMTVAVVGILAGAASAAGLMRVLSALVFGVSVRDPWIYAGVSAILTLVAILSCILPALRASRVDPMQALRLD
jgi:putative ABC transport system permease protein